MRFGEIVGDARRSRGITVRGLGRAIQICASNISEMEQGSRLPPEDKAIIGKFAKFLGLDFAVLQEAARIERKARRGEIFERRLFKINPGLACKFAYAVEKLNDAKLNDLFLKALNSLKS